MIGARDLSDAFAAVGDRWGDARLRRFLSACCERVRHLIPDGAVWELVAACSGSVRPAEMDRIWSAAREASVASDDFASAVVVQMLPLETLTERVREAVGLRY